MNLVSEDGHSLDAYLAEPSGSVVGAIVIIQEIFGLNDHMKSVTNRFARDGFVAITPALYDRLRKGITYGYGPDEYKEAMKTRRRLTWDAALMDVEAAHKAVSARGKVGVVGYCFGGSVAWLAATRRAFACAVSYYGGAVAEFSNEKPKCPVICHIGEHDHAISATKVETIRQNRPEIPVYVYEGAGHGFNCDERASWNADAARLAYERTCAFLRTHLG